MTPEQFWQTTPREFAAFAQVKERADEVAAVRWAVMAAMFANANFRGPQHPQAFTHDDFLGRSHSTASLPSDRQLVNGVPVMSKEEMRFNLAAAGMLPEDQVPEWAKATVAASKANRNGK